MRTKQILIIGSGSWGTALGQVLADNNHSVLIYGRNNDEVVDINNHKNTKYFQDTVINKNLKAVNDLNECFKNKFDLIVFAVPSIAINEVAFEIKPFITNEIILNVAKGFDVNGNSLYKFLKETFKENSVISLLGPSHAEEVILRKLTFVNIVDKNDKDGYLVSEMFNNFYFKTQVINDIEGAEMATNLKNAIALMSGIYEGLGFGDNARAALYTDGLNEMLLLGTKLNIDQNTLLSYVGVGDLAVTCYSKNSRNFRAGEQIGRLNSFESFIKSNNMTVEGLRAVKYLYDLKNKLNIKLSIITCLYNIIYKNIEPLYAVDNLINKKEGIYE